MHPILFHIPLPHMPLRLWWALALVAFVAFAFGLSDLRRGDKASAVSPMLTALGACAVAWVMRDKTIESPNLPMFSYGVLLGLALIAGWFVSLRIADKGGLPKDTVATAYVIGAISAILAARFTHVAFHWEDFDSWSEPVKHLTASEKGKSALSNFLARVLSLRSGGLSTYGGMLGALGATLLFLRSNAQDVPAAFRRWADALAPAFGVGTLFVGLGAYLHGGDFGVRLSDGAPGLLKKLGTFSRWPEGGDAGAGSPAWLRHRELYSGTPLGADMVHSDKALPVHPTQIYVMLGGLVLAAITWMLLRKQDGKPRHKPGIVAAVGAYTYALCTFMVETVRDRVDSGSTYLSGAKHLLVPFCLALFALAFAYGIALTIRSAGARKYVRYAAFAIPVLAYAIMRPATFAGEEEYGLSGTQLFSLLLAAAASRLAADAWRKPAESLTARVAMTDDEDAELA